MAGNSLARLCIQFGIFTSRYFTLYRMQLADYNASMITNVGYKSILTLVYDTDMYHLSSSVLHDEGLVLSLVLFYLLLHLLHINAISKVEDCIRH